MQSFIKQANETKTFSVDFSPVLATAETISLGNVTTSSINYLTGAAASIISPGTIGVAAGVISFKVVGGVADTPYKLTIKTGLTNYSNIHEEDLILLIVDDVTMLYSVDELKASLSISNNTQDAVLYGIVRAASDYVENFTKRKFALRTYTETLYPTTSSTCLLLSNFPIQSVSSLMLGGETLSEIGPSNEANWVIESGGYLSRIDGGTFPSRPTPIVVTYRAGYPILPEDVRNVVKKIASEEYNLRKKGGVLGEDIGNYKILYNTKISSLEAPLLLGTLSRYSKVLF